MTWQVSVVSRGTEYNLSDNQDYLLTGIDGIAAAPVARISERGPMQHGESDLGYRLQPRRIALALMVRGGDTAAWFARRETLLRIFRSSDSPVKLKIVNGDIVRQVDCHLSGTMEMAPEVGLSPRWQRVGIELLAPDPIWYDPVGVTEIFELGAGGQTMDIPLAIPWKVGASTISTTRRVNYAGTWDAWPVVIITGPITNCVITNETMGDRLDFTGTTIGAGVSYTIDCRYGYKTVTRSDGANRVQDLTANSNLATFRVGAHPDVLDGVNIFRVRGSGCTAATQVVLQFHTRYVGV